MCGYMCGAIHAKAGRQKETSHVENPGGGREWEEKGSEKEADPRCKAL